MSVKGTLAVCIIAHCPTDSGKARAFPCLREEHTRPTEAVSILGEVVSVEWRWEGAKLDGEGGRMA